MSLVRRDGICQPFLQEIPHATPPGGPAPACSCINKHIFFFHFYSRRLSPLIRNTNDTQAYLPRVFPGTRGVRKGNVFYLMCRRAHLGRLRTGRRPRDESRPPGRRHTLRASRVRTCGVHAAYVRTLTAFRVFCAHGNLQSETAPMTAASLKVSTVPQNFTVVRTIKLLRTTYCRRPGLPCTHTRIYTYYIFVQYVDHAVKGPSDAVHGHTAAPQLLHNDDHVHQEALAINLQ